MDSSLDYSDIVGMPYVIKARQCRLMSVRPSSGKGGAFVGARL